MEESRIIYETLMGKRVGDTHWWRVKAAMNAFELPMNKEGFDLFISLRNTSPRYFSQYHKVKAQITKLESAINEGITGSQFVKLLDSLQISPDQSTISRWFKSCGGFRAKQFYCKTVLVPIVAIALIYKYKVHSNQLSKVS